MLPRINEGIVKIVKEIDEILAEIDTLIRQGKGSLATERLKTVKSGDLTSATDRARYAALARRLSLTDLALRLLNPIVRPEGRLKSEATDPEKLEYAASLTKIRAISEAIEILKTIPADRHPDSLLFQAFAHIVQWDYRKAIPLLIGYVNAPSITPYQRLVGQANLCEALVHDGRPDAFETIEKTLAEAKERSFPLIFGYVQMAKLELLITERNWTAAESLFRETEAAFQSNKTLETFFVKKWGAILNLRKNGANDETLERISSIRSEAITNWRHWDTVRDCDLHEASVTRNPSLLQHVYFGTPFNSFRERLNVTPDDTYRWILGKGDPSETLELFTGDGSLRKSLLGAGNLRYRLLWVLSRDFYRPVRTAQLGAELYPGEYFNPVSTPMRVRQAVFRLRQWLATMKSPLRVEEIDGAYRLSASRPIALLLPNPGTNTQVDEQPELSVVREAFRDRDSFTARDVGRLLSICVRSANRVLKDGENRSLLVRTGKGRATRYHWASNESMKRVA